MALPPAACALGRLKRLASGKWRPIVDDLLLRLGVFALVGLGAGYASGLFGVGGGIIRIPVFVYLLPLFGVAHPVLMHMAIGTSISLVIPTSIVATWRQSEAGNLDWSYYRTWAVGIFIGVVAGLLLLPMCSTEALKVIFIVFLTSVGIYVGFVRDDLVLSERLPSGALKVAIAAVIGCFAALTGTAGGTFTTPTMKAFSMPLKRAIALASATGVVTGVAATAGAVIEGWNAVGRPTHSMGFVDLGIFAAMVPTTFAGAALGVRSANSLDKAMLQRSYTIVLFAMAADMIRGMLG
jgi:uncharacterized membrane protein YfcA